MELRFDVEGKKDRSWTLYDDKIVKGEEEIPLREVRIARKTKANSAIVISVNGRSLPITLHADPAQAKQVIEAEEYINDYIAGRISSGNEESSGTSVSSINYNDASTFSYASGKNLQYVVLQVTLKEKFIGTGSANLTELEDIINKQASKGYRLHTISTTNSSSKGVGGGDRIQATMVFEKLV